MHFNVLTRRRPVFAHIFAGIGVLFIIKIEREKNHNFYYSIILPPTAIESKVENVNSAHFELEQAHLSSSLAQPLSLVWFEVAISCNFEFRILFGIQQTAITYFNLGRTTIKIWSSSLLVVVVRRPGAIRMNLEMDTFFSRLLRCKFLAPVLEREIIQFFSFFFFGFSCSTELFSMNIGRWALLAGYTKPPFVCVQNNNSDEKLNGLQKREANSTSCVNDRDLCIPGSQFAC